MADVNSYDTLALVHGINSIFSFIDLGSAFWGMVLVLASTKLLTARIAAGCLVVTLIVVLFVAKNVSDNQFP